MSPDACPRCKGTGVVEVGSFADPSKNLNRACHICHGRGVLKPDPPPAGISRQALEGLIAEFRENSDRAGDNARNPHIGSMDQRQCFGVSQAYDDCADRLAALLKGPPDGA